MDAEALQRAQERIEAAARVRVGQADLDATLSRARDQVAALAATAAALEATLPDRVGDAVQDGIRSQVIPVARNIAEVRGLLNHLIARSERVDADLLAERQARVEDLAVLVDLIVAGWRGVEERLERIEKKLGGNLVALPLAS